MNHSMPADPIQSALAQYAAGFGTTALPEEVRRAAINLVIDTLGVLVAGFDCEPCARLRPLAAQSGTATATVIGTATSTTPDIAAYVNATTARYVEANDVYARFRPGAMHGHPSDVITPLLAVAESVNAAGPAFIDAVVLAYEVYLALCDNAKNGGFDPSTFGVVAVALGAGKLMGLNESALAHAAAMAAVPHNLLKQVRSDQISAWKALAAGEAGRAGVFAATLAKLGLPGPNLPFTGSHGWCTNIAGRTFTLDDLGGNGQPYRTLGARIKPRPARALTIPSLIAAEKVHAQLGATANVRRIVVEVHKQAHHGTHDEHWNPDSRETADHSIPFGVAAALLEGHVTPASFDDAHLADVELRRLMKLVEVVENEGYSRAFTGTPQEYRARVTVERSDGGSLSAESGGDEDDLARPKSDAQIDAKFRVMAETRMGTARAQRALEALRAIDTLPDVAVIPPMFVLD